MHLNLTKVGLDLLFVSLSVVLVGYLRVFISLINLRTRLITTLGELKLLSLEVKEARLFGNVVTEDG